MEMSNIDEELIYILEVTEIEEDPVADSILIPTYNINACEITEDAYYYIMDLIKKDLRNRNITGTF